MNAAPVKSWRRFDFDALPSFSRRQARASNTLHRIFASGAGWEAWIAEGLTEFFESPAGFEIRLRQRHTMDPQHAEALFTSTSGELTLGRDETCDVRLAPRSVGNHHTRIFIRGGRCYIEDLGSALGTFLNESRLVANRPAPIANGDQFAIFPYTFTVELTERWVRDASVDVCAGPVLSRNWRDFQNSAASERVSMTVQVQPVGAGLLIEASRTFVERLSACLLAPLCSGIHDRLGLTSVNTGVLELLLAAVLERMNRDLQFPLQAELAPTGFLPKLRDEEAGLMFSFALRVAELTGTFRLFVTDEALALLGSSPAPQARATLLNVSWAFPVSAGHVELTTAEVALIEPSDVVLLTQETAILFPNAANRGWRLLTTPDNLSEATIDNYFEKGCLSENESERELVADSGAAPDLAGLPIRMHAIIGEKEMTLAEANLLIAGAIVELDRMKSDPVRIALNGKIAGVGELVEVDGRLGVRILSWRIP